MGSPGNIGKPQLPLAQATWVVAFMRGVNGRLCPPGGRSEWRLQQRAHPERWKWIHVKTPNVYWKHANLNIDINYILYVYTHTCLSQSFAHIRRKGEITRLLARFLKWCWIMCTRSIECNYSSLPPGYKKDQRQHLFWPRLKCQGGTWRPEGLAIKCTFEALFLPRLSHLVNVCKSKIFLWNDITFIQSPAVIEILHIYASFPPYK